VSQPAPDTLAQTIILDGESLGLARRVEELAGTELMRCYQCRTCSGGCPFYSAMDYGPHGVMRLLQLGQREEVLTCNTIWLCVGCQTCSAACPMAIDIAAVMDVLRQMALELAMPVPESRVLVFHREVLKAIERYGRTHKLQVMLRYKISRGDWLSDMDLGLKMLAKRKLHLLPSRIRQPRELERLFEPPWRRKP